MLQLSVPGAALLHAWTRTLTDLSDRPALFNPAGEILRTFAEIASDAETFLSEIDLPEGSVVAFSADNEPAWIACFLALLRQGSTVLLLESQAAALPSFSSILERCGVTAVASLCGGKLHIAQTGFSAPRWDAAPAILKVTSGTGGLARAIRFTSEQILADCRSVCDTMGITRQDRNYGAISMAHSYGFSNLVTPLIAQGVPLVVTNDRMPRSILNGLELSGATVFPGTPIFFQKINELAIAAAPGNLRLAISAGAPLVAEVAAEFLRRTGIRIHVFYGSSECGGICYDATESGEIPSGYVGSPMKNVTLTVDESGRPTVQSPAVGTGYFPEEIPEVLSDGAFRPGDLLEAASPGYRVIGRVSDLINVAGRKVNPADVEAVLLTLPGVKQAIVFGVANEARGEMPAACVIAEGVEEEQLIAHCRRRLPSWQAPKFVRIVDEIPLTSRGKISRAELGRRFAGIANRE